MNKTIPRQYLEASVRTVHDMREWVDVTAPLLIIIIRRLRVTGYSLNEILQWIICEEIETILNIGCNGHRRMDPLVTIYNYYCNDVEAHFRAHHFFYLDSIYGDDRVSIIFNNTDLHVTQNIFSIRFSVR